jgi:DNA-binding SARP family transcriptional activator
LQPPGRTRIQLCGRLLIELDGRRVEDLLPSRQGRLLFAYLALNADRPVRREELIDCLWPQSPPADPMAAVNTLISRLRRALGPDTVQGRSELSLALPPDAEIDVAFVADALDRARSAVADGDWQAAWGPAHAALAITQRGLLPGLEASWIDEGRRDLNERELEALELVAEVGLGLGGAELAAAERAAKTLVEKSPFRESGHRLRMQVLAARGNVAEALQAYEEVRKLLAQELGTTPSAGLVALHERLVRGALTANRGDGGFVGRRRELEQLEAALSTARNGSRRLVLVAGDAGIGKTRLVEELGRRATDEGANVAWGRCYEGQGAPAFWPWVEVVRAIARSRRPDQLRRALGRAAADIAQIVPELGELFSDLAPPPRAAPESARFRLYDACSGFFARTAAIAPLVVVLDDLQWADPPSLELLEFLATRPNDAPILMVATYRSAQIAARHPLADTAAKLASESHVTRIELGGLGERELATFVAVASGGVEVPDALIAAVRHRTEGNPFFVSELVRLLQGEGELEGERAETILRHEVPSGVRDVIRRRLAWLPEESIELLGVAAVIGERFELDLLARASRLEDDRALEILEPARRDRIVADEPGSVGRYRFSHALTREVLQAEVGAVRAARLHWLVTEALDDLHGDDEERLVELADHAYQAASAGDLDRAYCYAVRAAEQATGRLAYEQAEQQLRRALEVVAMMETGSDRAGRELDLQLRLGALLMSTEGYAAPEVGAACTRAEELCREIGDERLLLPALWRLGVFHEVRADFPRQEQIAVRLLEVAERTAEPIARLCTLMMLAPPAIHKGAPRRARELLEEAIAIADRLDASSLVESFGHNHQVTSRGFMACALSLLGAEEGGPRSLIDEALRRARQVPNPIDEAFAVFLAALCAVIADNAELAQRRAEELTALSLERGLPMFAATGTIIGGWAAAARGEPEAGAAAVAEGIDAFEATGARMMLNVYLALLADAQRRAGRREQSLATVEAGLSHVDASNRLYEAELQRLKGELLLELHPEATEEAERALRTAATVAREQQAATLQRRAEASLGQLAQR